MNGPPNPDASSPSAATGTTPTTHQTLPLPTEAPSPSTSASSLIERMRPGSTVASKVAHYNRAFANTRWGRLRRWMRTPTGKRSVFASLATFILLFGTLLGVALWPNSEKAPETKFVALYVTDLPGDLEKLEITIATATVGTRNHALDVEVPVLELSALQGPEEAMRIASGFVPLDEYDGSISLVFADARGFKDGAWVDIDIPQARLTLEHGLPPDQFREVASLMDFDLDTSLVIDGDTGGFEFRPYVKNVYQYGGNETRIENVDNSVSVNSTLNLTSLLDIDLEDLVTIELPTQMLETVADELVKKLVDELCGRLSCTPLCSPMPMCLGSGGNFPPLVPFDPVPASGSLGVSAKPLLAWTSGDPENDPVTYRVLVNDRLVCTVKEAACQPGQLDYNSTVSWHVVAVDNHGGTTLSPKWTFTTLGQGIEPPKNHAPNLPTSPVPATGLKQIVHSPTLSWTGGDPDGDLVMYKVTVDGKVMCTTREPQCPLTLLAPSAKVSWSVLATDEHGLNQTGPTWEFTVLGKDEKPPVNRAPFAPSAPSPLSGVGNQGVSVVLRWVGGDPDADPVDYRVLVDEATTPSRAACAWQPETSCVSAGLTPGKTYSWKVEARDDKGLTNASVVWTFATAATPTNSAPNTPVAKAPALGTTIGNVKPELTWTGGDPDGDDVSYVVAVDGATKCTTTQLTCAIATALADKSSHTWSVTATDAPQTGTAKTASGGPWTFTLDTSLGNRAPNPANDPTPVNDVMGLASVAALTWVSGSDPDADPVQFQVMFGTENPPTATLCSWKAEQTCAPPVLSQATKYYWRVDSTDGKATTMGPVWSLISNRPPELAFNPGPIDGKNSPTQNTDGSVTLTWTATDPDSQSLQYRVLSSSSNPPDALRCDWSPSPTCSSGIYLTPEVWTYWRVDVKDSVGEVRIGNVWKFMVVGGQSDGQVHLSDTSAKHDTSPSKHTPEVARSLKFTPGLNQYVVISKISGKMAYDGTAKGAHLTSTIVGHDAQPAFTGSAAPPDPTQNPYPGGNSPYMPPDSNLDAPAAVAYCAANQYFLGERAVNYQSPIGQTVEVQFLLDYTPPSNVQSSQDTVTEICMKETKVTYTLVTVPVV